MTDIIDSFSEESYSIDWIGGFFRRWRIAALFSGIVLIASIIFMNYSAEKQARYYAETRILIGPERLSIKTTDGNLVERERSITDTITLLGSDMVIRKAAKIMKEKYGYYKENEEHLVLELKRSLKVETKRGQAGISISATTDTADKAYHFISALLDGYQEHIKEDEQKFFKETYETFTQQLNIARKSLLDAENRLAKFITENESIVRISEEYVASADEGGDFIAASMSRELLKLKTDISNLHVFITTVKDLTEDDKLAALSLLAERYPDRVNQEYKAMHMGCMEELDNLLEVNQEAHPAVIQARAELKAIEKRIDNEINTALKRVELDLSEILMRKTELERFIKEGVHEKVIEYNMLKNDIHVKREICDNLAEELQHIDLGEKIERYSEIKILEPHKMPEHRKDFFDGNPIFYGLILGFVTLVGTIYIFEKIDTSVKSIDHMERLVEVPVLSGIPIYKPSMKSHKDKDG